MLPKFIRLCWLFSQAKACGYMNNEDGRTTDNLSHATIWVRAKRFRFSVILSDSEASHGGDGAISFASPGMTGASRQLAIALLLCYTNYHGGVGHERKSANVVRSSLGRIVDVVVSKLERHFGGDEPSARRNRVRDACSSDDCFSDSAWCLQKNAEPRPGPTCLRRAIRPRGTTARGARSGIAIRGAIPLRGEQAGHADSGDG